VKSSDVGWFNHPKYLYNFLFLLTLLESEIQCLALKNLHVSGFIQRQKKDDDSNVLAIGTCMRYTRIDGITAWQKEKKRSIKDDLGRMGRPPSFRQFNI